MIKIVTSYASQLRLLVTLLVASSLATLATAETNDQCSAQRQLAMPGLFDEDNNNSVAEQTIEISADRAEVNPDGLSELSGNVSVEFEDRLIQAESASYDATSNKIEVAGTVAFKDDNLIISGDRASFSSVDRTGKFVSSRFELLDRNGRGDASDIEIIDDNLLVLKDVRYTACPQGENDWRFVAPEISINRASQVGQGRNVRVEFKGVPILYAPFISFPVGEARKSGFLLPGFSSNERSGRDISLPYYWNIAPNYDALFTLRHLSDRGAQLGVESRYLFAHSEGTINSEFLIDDDLTGENRVHGKIEHRTRFNNGFSINIDAEDVSDGEYFEDLTSSLAGASITHLERRIDLVKENRNWTVGIRGQAFNTLDDTIADLDTPYKRLPQLWASAQYGAINQINLEFYSDFTNFERDDGARGWRSQLQPAISYPFGNSGYLIEPKIALSASQYDLKELQLGNNEANPSRTIPIYSLDGKLFFERDAGNNGKKIQTLEPRIRYTHIPFVNQDQIPLFDSGNPDLNLVQLFRDNRYTSVDRIGDTDQLSFGLTTRLLDTENGRELLSATFGQAFFFSERAINLPGEQIVGDSSNAIAEVGLSLSRHWNADFEYQWDPQGSRTDKAVARVQYRPAENKVINLAYRFQRNDLEQSDLSFAWPIGDNWNLVGRWNYSLDENRTLERFAGVEYNRCCWSARLVSRRFLNDRSGGQDTALFAQFELKGLTSIGARVDAFLERGILGYGQQN